MAAAELGDVADRLEVVRDVIAALRIGSCEPVDDVRRLCRSLFLIASTDPLAGLGAGLDRGQIEQLIELHRWALAEGSEAADLSGDTDAAGALRALERIDVGAALVGGQELADTAVARADRSIVGPLIDAEQDCLSLPR